MINEIELNPSCDFETLETGEEKLCLRIWKSKKLNADALALLVHGLGAHSGWFEAFARELALRGFMVFAYDQRGFGARQNAPFRCQKEWSQDLSDIAAALRKEYPGLPLYLMGNSMGALVVIAASLSTTCDGIVLFSPGFGGHPKAFSLAYKLKSIAKAFLSPKSLVELPYETSKVTRSLAVRRFLDEDKAKRLAVPAYMLLELLKLSLETPANLKKLKKPLLMITAGHELVVDNELSQKLFESLNHSDKKQEHYADAWHDLMFDPQLDEVAESVSKWQKENKQLRTAAEVVKAD